MVTQLTYIALLRGINVGRAKRVAMADVRALVSGLGFRDVRTLLNSGNVVFTGVKAVPSRIAGRIETALTGELGVSARIVVLTAAELATAAAANPLVGIATNPSRLLLAFPATSADAARLGPLLDQDWAPEAFALGSRTAYLWCPDGIALSRLAAEVGRALSSAVTMRNWVTVGKLLALSAKVGR